MNTNEKLNGAIFSDCRKYRFALWRIWDESKPKVMFIGLNPSTANESEPDNTIKRAILIAKYNGFGGIYMTNCFPFVSTDPSKLEVDGSVERNNTFLLSIATNCQEVVFAWGNFKIVSKLKRDLHLINMFPNAKAIWINKNGSPKHPLFCKASSQLISFR